jgi:hypothetical protein
MSKIDFYFVDKSEKEIKDTEKRKDNKKENQKEITQGKSFNQTKSASAI